MSWLGLWKPVYINRSKRPILIDDEYTVFIKDHIGLYQGKSKIINRQDGRIYLTNKRLIYFDNDIQSNSMSLDLNTVTSSELIERFLRSSPKVKLFLHLPNTAPAVSNVIHWVCKICSFKNSLAQPVDLLNLPLCQSCGVKANLTTIQQALDSSSSADDTQSSDHCPTCTFINHPSLKNCEICGTQLTVLTSLMSKLASSNIKANTTLPPSSLDIRLQNEESYTSEMPYIKLSFRKGGELKFQHALSKILDDIKWENLKINGRVNVNEVDVPVKPPPQNKLAVGGGIRGLEQISEQQRKLNASILANSLNDLEQLMFKFQDLIHLTKAVNNKNNNSNKLAEIKQVIPPLHIDQSSSLYLQELSRHICEYTTTILTSPSSMITSQDLFANYNRYIVTTQGFAAILISAQHFNLAIALFPQLNLPISIHKYENSGLVVLSPKQTNYSSYGKFIVEFLRQQYYQYRYDSIKDSLRGDGEKVQFRGNTIAEISEHFNWAYNITIEEIDRGVADGTILIDNHISGTFHYLNIYDSNNYNLDEEEMATKARQELSKEQLLEQELLEKQLQEQLLGQTSVFAPLGQEGLNFAQNDSGESSDAEFEPGNLSMADLLPSGSPPEVTAAQPVEFLANTTQNETETAPVDFLLTQFSRKLHTTSPPG